MQTTLMEKINKGRQYRNMILEVKNLAPDEGAFIVRGYATTFSETYTLFDFGDYRVDEMVDAHAFDECDMSDVIMQFDHEGRVFARTSNGTLKLTIDAHGLLVEADLGGTEIGRQLYEEIKGGYVSKMSFGFTVAEDEIQNLSTAEKEIYLRVIKKIGKLYDVSAVSLPANDGTEISARSFCDGVIAELEAERLQCERTAKIEALEQRINEIIEGGNKHGD